MDGRLLLIFLGNEMVRITVVFYGILYGKQVSEWTVPLEKLEMVSNTISYLIAGRYGVKNIVSINIKAV